MTWDNTLYLSIVGTTITFGLVAWTTVLGIRYRRELPKLRILDDIAALRIERENEEAKIAELQSELVDARATIAEKERSEVWLEENRPEVARLQEELTQLQAEMARLESVKKEREDVTQELASLRDQTVELQRDYEQIRVEGATAKAKLEAAREELSSIDQLREEHEDLKVRVPALHSQYQQLLEQVQGKSKELTQVSDDLQSESQKLGEVRGELEGCKAELEHLRKSIERLGHEYTQQGGVSEKHDPCAELWNPIFAETDRTIDDAQELDRLGKMHETLMDNGVSMPRRTLWAFHTALKIQDISPLSVLAGISGTGKSLLPLLYARCMGVRYLNLPVQPGWNSPQDLFGFYNYIEQKFVATDLSRALVQFDPINRAKWEEWEWWDLSQEELPDLSDQVLLVLLDEMNLARIEYYFSELLSRLETRRTIEDDSDDEGRRKAEIPLTAGRRKDEEYEIAVYPGSNVLFAGTMNEDESTLSLSDKVLDRASVLRFGKPRNLITNRPSMDAIMPSTLLSLGNWQKWCEGKAEPNWLKDHINQLGGIMEDADVPFGHRVSQAITRYVSVYPAVSEQGHKDALADQIEQKILPKIRGKDLTRISSSLNHLLTIVSELGDDELVEAINKGMKNPDNTFLWSGLDRLNRTDS